MHGCQPQPKTPTCGAVQVGAFLLAFLPTSLQEQMSSRKYFYKSGRLIKDGIITLTNTDFSTDIMNQVWLSAILVSMYYIVTVKV